MAAQLSAFDLLNDILKRYGLEQLASFAQGFITRYDQIDENLFMIELRQQDAYKKRFSANEERIKNGLPALPEDEYLAMEAAYKNVMRVSGLPAGFYDSQDDFQTFLANDVSPEELQSRVNEGYNAVKMANPEVVKQMRSLYGVSEGQLAAYFLDPTRSIEEIKIQAQAATIAAQGRLQAGMGVSVQQAEELARYGVTEQEAMQGFGAIEQAQGLFTANLEEQRSFTQQEQIGAAFGTSAAAQQRLRQRARKRQAQFETGGGFASGAEGTTAIA